MRISDWSSDVCSSDLLRPGNTAYDGRFEVPTLAEIIALAKRESTARRRTISIYPETKHPSYFASIGHPIEARLVAQLKAAGWDSADAPVFIQSFEVDNLKALHALTPEIGRASCRERVCQYVYISVVAVSFKKKTQLQY